MTRSTFTTSRAIVPTLQRGNAVVPLLRHGTQSVHKGVPTEAVETMQNCGRVRVVVQSPQANHARD